MKFVFVPFLFPFAFLIGMFALIFWSQAQQRKRQQAYWQTLPPSRERLPESPTCPRCRSAMDRGYLLDRTHGGFGVGTWLEGPPRISNLGNLIRPRLERSIPIACYRCTGCGFLELYARPELVADLSTGKPASYSEL